MKSLGEEKQNIFFKKGTIFPRIRRTSEHPRGKRKKITSVLKHPTWSIETYAVMYAARLSRDVLKKAVATNCIVGTTPEETARQERKYHLLETEGIEPLFSIAVYSSRNGVFLLVSTFYFEFYHPPFLSILGVQASRNKNNLPTYRDSRCIPFLLSSSFCRCRRRSRSCERG